MASIIPVSDLNSDLERTAIVGERVSREYAQVPFLARDHPDPRYAKPVVGPDYLKKAKRFAQRVIEDSKMKASQDPEIRNLSRYIDLLMGRMWSGAAPSWRRRPVVNKLIKFFWDNLANLADLRFSLDIVTSSTEPNFQNIAATLTKLCQSNFEANDAIASVLFCAMYASLGIGYLKITRDRAVRDITYTPLGPDSCVEILSNVFDIQKSGGVIHRAMKPMSWFQTHHKAVAPMIRPQRPPVDMYSQSDALALGATTYMGWSRQQGNLGVSSLLNASTDQFSVQSFATEEGSIYDEIHFRDPQVNTTKQDLWMGYGNWTYRVQPGQLMYPFGRMMSVANESDPVLCWDGTNMHWHAMYPFVRFKSSPVFWMMSGMSDLRDLVAINNPFNRILAAAMNLLEQAERPTVVTREGSLPNEAWNNFMPGTPGGKLKLLGRMQAILEQIQFIHPPIGVLGAAATFLSFLDNQFAQQSGQGYGSKMASKKQVPGEGSVQAIQESEQGRYRVKGIFTELSYKQMGRLVMSDIVQFWDPDKVVSVLGPDEQTWEYLNVEPGGIVPDNVRNGDFPLGHKFVNQFGVMMAAGSSLPVKRREQAQLAMALSGQGKMSMKTLYKKLNAVGAGLPDPEAEMQQITKERQMGIGVMPVKGKGAQKASVQAVPAEGPSQ